MLRSLIQAAGCVHHWLGDAPHHEAPLPACQGARQPHGIDAFWDVTTASGLPYPGSVQSRRLCSGGGSSPIRSALTTLYGGFSRHPSPNRLSLVSRWISCRLQHWSTAHRQARRGIDPDE